MRFKTKKNEISILSAKKHPRKGENGALQIKTTFKLKTLLTIEAYPKREYGFVLIFDKEKSSDTTFAAGSRQKRKEFLSSLLSLCSTTNSGRVGKLNVTV